MVRAAEVVGTKLLEPQVVQALQSPRYRSILRKLPDEPVTFSFRRAELLERLITAEAKVLDNFLTRMRQLGMIVQDTEAGRGCYQFANQLHYLYFWLEAQKARHERTPSS